MLFFLTSLLFAAVPTGWDLVGTTNGVEVARKKAEGTNVFAFRGEATTDISVAKLISILTNEVTSPKWVNMMVGSDVIKTYDANTNLLHQTYDIPWPMDDRDYLFKKTIEFDSTAKKAMVHLTSVEDSLMPPQDGYVRAEGEKTLWSFEVLPSGKTKIIVEVMTDPKGAMPDWLVNSVQEDWPHKTITSLLSFATSSDAKPHTNCAGWQ
jgi:hypothetical protein